MSLVYYFFETHCTKCMSTNILRVSQSGTIKARSHNIQLCPQICIDLKDVPDRGWGGGVRTHWTPWPVPRLAVAKLAILF